MTEARLNLVKPILDTFENEEFLTKVKENYLNYIM